MTNLNLPKNMQLIDHGNYLEIVRVWRGLHTISLAGFTVVWCVFLWGIYGIFPSLENSWMNYKLPFFAFGIYLIYYVIADIFNKTYIIANDSKIEIRHRPVPWFGNRKLYLANIIQLYVTDDINREEDACNKDYQLHALMQSGKKITMLSNLPGAYQAEYVKERLEALLHIKDQSVRGEYR